jgi:hypothetical protein
MSRVSRSASAAPRNRAPRIDCHSPVGEHSIFFSQNTQVRRLASISILITAALYLLPVLAFGLFSANPDLGVAVS